MSSLRKREYIAEGKLKDSSLRTMARMTDQNDHGGALRVGAEMLGLVKIAKKAELINKLHDLEGHLPKELYDYRYSLHKELMKAAEMRLTADEYKRFRKAY